MNATPLPVPGSFVIETDLIADARGFYLPCWRAESDQTIGIANAFKQVNLVVTLKRGTLRGLHWQRAPEEEAKLVYCSRGKIFDVIVDTRQNSSCFGSWAGVELSGSTYRLVYVPPGCAHGLLTLEDDTEVFYLSTGNYCKAYERGLRYDDPTVGIQWPEAVLMVSSKDLAWPPLTSS
jgi:dTDP-4-dehydrorhamnose 3,5-epimerase